MRARTTAALALLAFVLLVGWSVLPAAAQDVLLGSLRFTGPTTARTFTLPDANATLATSVTTGAWKLAAGSITLDGTNPSSATTGLAAIIACTVTDKRATTPGDEVLMFTTGTAATAGQLDVYAWANTTGSDPTLVASTDANDVVDYICIGS